MYETVCDTEETRNVRVGAGVRGMAFNVLHAIHAHLWQHLHQLLVFLSPHGNKWHLNFKKFAASRWQSVHACRKSEETAAQRSVESSTRALALRRIRGIFGLRRSIKHTPQRARQWCTVDELIILFNTKNVAKAKIVS